MDGVPFRYASLLERHESTIDFNGEIYLTAQDLSMSKRVEGDELFITIPTDESDLKDLSYASRSVNLPNEGEGLKYIRSIIEGWTNSISEGRMTKDIIKGAVEKVRSNKNAETILKDLGGLIKDFDL